VQQNGKLQARRFAYSGDNRSILLTSNKIRSVKNLFKYATQKQEIDEKEIAISTIVRVQLGGLTNRFLMARYVYGNVHYGSDLWNLITGFA
jgi:hypothetical protein